jgi:hypothetical protein
MGRHFIVNVQQGVKDGGRNDGGRNDGGTFGGEALSNQWTERRSVQLDSWTG